MKERKELVTFVGLEPLERREPLPAPRADRRPVLIVMPVNVVDERLESHLRVDRLASSGRDLRPAEGNALLDRRTEEPTGWMQHACVRLEPARDYPADKRGAMPKRRECLV